MASLVTKPAPEIKAEAIAADNQFVELNLSDYKGKYVILFFYPMDFTFVCPTEIIAFDKKLEEFKKRETEVIGVSVDSKYTHFAWKNTAVDKGGIGPIKYPLVADLNKKISRDYGVLLEEDGVALRGLFLIDKTGIVRHELINDLPLGRNVDEAIRILDALRFNEKYGEVCPANWKEGEEGLNATSEGVAAYLSKHAH